MLLYSGKSKYAYLSIKANQAKEFKEYLVRNTWWWKWLRLIVQTVSAIGIGILGKFIDVFIPGLGTFIEFALNTLIDLMFNLIENEGKIDFVDFGLSAGFNAAGAISKVFKQFKAARVKNNVLSLADNIKDSSEQFKSQFKNSAKKLTLFGTRTLKENAIPNYKAFKNTSSELVKTLDKSKQIFKETAIASKQSFEKTKTFLNKTTKVFTKIRTFVSLLTSPRYAAKKAIDIAIKKPRKKIVKIFNNFISKKVKEVFLKGKKTLREAMKRIPLNSSWLDNITIIQPDNTWSLKFLNAIVRFKKRETNNKKPVVLWQKDSKLIMEFLTTSSPGRHYLKYFAWGWDIGKILRNYSGFIALTKIPLFSNLIGTLANSYRTINAIHESIKKDNWLWKQNFEDIKADMLKGVKEGALKGWNFKYIRPAISVARSAIEGKGNYAIRAGEKAIKKTAFYVAYSKKIKNYSYKKPKGGRRWKRK
ncbi:hypothetical protein [Metamycoplasma hyosynoviae]|uniref:hypothetical protein n=1 Tax=Metamycoplasma hyosynoviae TaxID=29559 RepID=UPI002358C7DE|nr:hypothetical protein [Metamycoplasma hyosynoviae]MDC8919265.1 hypothetical protein [Metamycoplasma hyosynoviae]MDC8919665.1 hypothetical protein [Metamycoplasma hyosynoviae]MDC8921724.1 hypothetical protein [Metamycoplasma hyosynoviae]